MRVTVEQIKAKIPDLPANAFNLVTIDQDDRSLAYVKSRTCDDSYTVHIKPHVEDPGDKSILNSTCPCDARGLCWHVAAFYAVSKGLISTESDPSPSEIHPSAEGVEEPAKDKCGELRRLTMESLNAQAKVTNEIIRLFEGE